jgi:hypothetical protein
MDQPAHFGRAAACALSTHCRCDEISRDIQKHPRNLCSAILLFPHPKHRAMEETAMKTLVSMLALGLVVAFSAPAFAGTKEPKTQAECTKAGMHWDTSAKKCSKGM